MNFKKFHHNGEPILVNLDNVTDIQTMGMGAEGKCIIYFASDQAQVSVDETFEQIQNLVEYSEK